MCGSPQSCLSGSQGRKSPVNSLIQPELQRRTWGLKKKKKQSRWNLGRLQQNVLYPSMMLVMAVGQGIMVAQAHSTSCEEVGRQANPWSLLVNYPRWPSEIQVQPCLMERSRGRWREQEGRGTIEICVDGQNFQRIREKYVKKVDSSPEQGPGSTVLTALGLNPSRSKIEY